MPNKLKPGKAYHINQQEYTILHMLEDHEQYWSGLARSKDGRYVQVKQYLEPLTQEKQNTIQALTRQDAVVPKEAVEYVRGRRVIYDNCVVEPHSGLTLGGYLDQNANRVHVEKAIELCQLLHKVHTEGYTLGNIGMNNIEVTKKGLRFRSAEFAQKTLEEQAREKDVEQLKQVIINPESSLLSPTLIDAQLTKHIFSSKMSADVLAACLVLNHAGNNAYPRVIEQPRLATEILEKYREHRNEPEALSQAVRKIVQSSFKERFDSIKSLRLRTPDATDSDVSTILPDLDDSDASIPGTPPRTPNIN